MFSKSFSIFNILNRCQNIKHNVKAYRENNISEFLRFNFKITRDSQFEVDAIQDLRFNVPCTGTHCLGSYD